ncbi:hypothetical protein BC831DRAFT_518757 [Entophlyctis helioformis]|nr:hypothetical protein BC831DRAFT_518757 [Entophlyctis helioformis]
MQPCPPHRHAHRTAQHAAAGCQLASADRIALPPPSPFSDRKILEFSTAHKQTCFIAPLARCVNKAIQHWGGGVGSGVGSGGAGSGGAGPRIIRTVAEYRSLRESWFREGLTVGFVPTMGALHEGHTTLAREARKTCDRVVASIFVNPAQFAPTEDLAKYPRTEEQDVRMLGAERVDVVFAPSVTEMYPAGITLQVKEQFGTFVEVKGKSHQMEGSIRPHFFRGVATVVSKLFNIMQPTHAYFGQKDVQQCSVIRSMVRDLFYPLQVVVVPTIRESDGLAMSSRNRYLSPSERAIAPVLYRALQASTRAFEAGTTSRDELVAVAEKVIAEEPGVKLEYISIADPYLLEEVGHVDRKAGAILSGAIRVGTTRIIDNVLLGLDPKGL